MQNTVISEKDCYFLTFFQFDSSCIVIITHMDDSKIRRHNLSSCANYNTFTKILKIKGKHTMLSKIGPNQYSL